MRLKKVLCAIATSSLLLTLGVTTSNDNAKEVEAAETGTAVYTITSSSAVSTSGAPEGTSATFKNTYTNNKQQITKNNSMTLTLTGYTGYTINSLTLSMHSNTSKGTGSLNVTVGTTTISTIDTADFSSPSWNNAYTNSFVDIKPTVTSYLVGEDETITIVVAATVNSLYVQSFTLGYEKVDTGEPSFSISCTEKDLEIGKEYPINYNCSNVGNPYISWTSDDETIATVEDGVVTPLKIGTTTITAAIEYNGNTYKDDCTFLVWPAANSTLTINEVNELHKTMLTIEDDVTPFSYNVTGELTYVSNNNATITDGTNTLSVFNARYSSINEKERYIVGDNCTFVGTIKNYSGNVQITVDSFAFNSQVAKVYLETKTELGFSVAYEKTGEEPTYTLVDDVASLNYGDIIVIRNNSNTMTLSETQASNNRPAVEVNSVNTQIIELEKGNLDGTFALNVGTGYLYAASDTKNYLRTEETLSDNSSWEISISDGVATLTAQGTNTRNTIYYNPNTANNNPLFSCYASVPNDGETVSIYKMSGGYDYNFDTKAFDNYSMRFSTTISEADVARILKDGETAADLTYGALIVPTAKLNEQTFEEIYAENNNVNFVTEYTAKDIELTYGDSMGVILNGLPTTDTSVSAVIYVIATDGTYYFANQVDYSVTTLVAKYMTQIDTLGLDDIQIKAVEALYDHLNPVVEA